MRRRLLVEDLGLKVGENTFGCRGSTSSQVQDEAALP
jgi:hypothetical protein